MTTKDLRIAFNRSTAASFITIIVTVLAAIRYCEHVDGNLCGYRCSHVVCAQFHETAETGEKKIM